MLRPFNFGEIRLSTDNKARIHRFQLNRGAAKRACETMGLTSAAGP